MNLLKSKKIVVVAVSLVFITTTSIFTIYRIARYVEVERILNPDYVLDTIIQTGPVREALPTVLLAELLDLSVDKPTNYFAFDEAKASRKLLNCPVITYAHVKKIKPNKVYIDYELRRPIALYADFENMAIDVDRQIFPLMPYFSPKQLPEIVLGEHKFSHIVTGEKIDLAFSVFLTFCYAGLGEDSTILRIDVSKAYCPSYGKREIIVVVEHKQEKHYLRLTEKNLSTGIANYVSLIQNLESQKATRVIDLRIEKLAYVEDIST